MQIKVFKKLPWKRKMFYLDSSFAEIRKNKVNANETEQKVFEVENTSKTK